MTDRPERWWILAPRDHRRYAEEHREVPDWLPPNTQVVHVPAPDSPVWTCDFCGDDFRIEKDDGTPLMQPMLTGHALCMNCMLEVCVKEQLDPFSVAEWSTSFCACPPCKSRYELITDPTTEGA